MTTKARCIATLTICLSAVLSGCATYRKCGIDGCAGDATITANVETILNQHSELGPPNSINVQTLDRVVYLSGFVSDGLDRETAESLAAKAPGVIRVENNIAVTH